MLRGLSTIEIVIILVILIVFFGGKKITELARGAGEATKELKDIKKDYEKTVKEVTDIDPLSTEPYKKGGD